MLIVNSAKTECVRSSDLVHLSQGDNCCVVAWSILAHGGKTPDIFLGRYDNPETAGIAFRMLIDAIAEDRSEVFYMPEKNDPAFKINTQKHASGLSYRQGKTNGKNH